MKDLNEFQAPLDGEITLCEIDGKLHSMRYDFYNINVFTTTVENHPRVHITRDILQPVTTGDEARALFLPADVPFLKLLIQTYYESGALETLRVAARRRRFLISDVANIILKAIDLTENVKSKWKASLSEYEALEGPSRLKPTSYSNIKCISWHPYSTKIAVACVDDTVRIFCDTMPNGPVLKYKQQRNITCLEWRPLSLSEIAVGCENGVYVWNVDPFTAITRPTISSATLLYKVNHTPVVSLTWSPWGDLLATCSSADSTVLVWDVELKESSPLKRPGSSGNHLLKWCTTGTRLFSAACGPRFRVWECLHWDAELWETPSGKVQAACWSPCGSALLFATSNDPYIYYLSFAKKVMAFNTKSTDGPDEAVPVVDCTNVDLEGVTVGGLIKEMDWDPKGHHLAVLFKNTNYVAIFRTMVQPVLQISASTLIAGMPEEVPYTIQFQKNFEYGTCLTVGWTSGRLQHFPIVYSANNVFSQSRRNLTDSPYTSLNVTQNRSYF